MNRILTKRSTPQVPFYLRVRLLRSQAPAVRVFKLGRHRDWHATKLRFPGRVASLAPSRRFLEVTPSRRRTCRVPQASEPGRARGPGPRRPRRGAATLAGPEGAAARNERTCHSSWTGFRFMFKPRPGPEPAGAGSCQLQVNW